MGNGVSVAAKDAADVESAAEPDITGVASVANAHAVRAAGTCDDGASDGSCSSSQQELTTNIAWGTWISKGKSDNRQERYYLLGRGPACS